MIKKLAVILFLIAFFGGPIWVASSSSSYKITTQVIEAGGASYKIR